MQFQWNWFLFHLHPLNSSVSIPTQQHSCCVKPLWKRMLLHTGKRPLLPPHIDFPSKKPHLLPGFISIVERYIVVARSPVSLIIWCSVRHLHVGNDMSLSLDKWRQAEPINQSSVIRLERRWRVECSRLMWRRWQVNYHRAHVSNVTYAIAHPDSLMMQRMPWLLWNAQRRRRCD